MFETYFKKIKVVELASVLAGPLVGSFLSELGCEVIKIENKIHGGDVTRQWKNKNEDQNAMFTAYYHAANYNKNTILLDFNQEKDLLRLDAIIREADIVISNYLPKVSLKFDLHPDQLHSKYPSLIIVQLNAFAQGEDTPGFDMVMQAETGYLSMSGTPAGDTTKIPVAMMDVLASHQMKEGVLLALLKKELEGVGSIVNVSLYQSAITGLVNQGTNFLNSNLVAQPMGTQHPNIAPYGDMIVSKEGEKLMLAIGSDQQFANFSIAIGRQDLLQKYPSNKLRIASRMTLMSAINKTTSQIGYDTLIALMKNKGIPYGEIKKIDKVFDHPLAKAMVLENANGGKTISSIAFSLES